MYVCIHLHVITGWLQELLGLLTFQEHAPIPVYHPTPSQARLATQLTEEEQIRIAQRIGLIQHLPKGIFDPGSEPSEKKIKEYVFNVQCLVFTLVAPQQSFANGA